MVDVGGISGCDFALTGAVLSQLFDNFYFDLQADNLIDQGRNLGQLVLSSASNVELLRELALVENFLKANVVIMDKSGLISNVSPGMQHHRRLRGGGQVLTPPQAAAVLSGQTVVIKGYRTGLDTTMLTVAVPITADDQVVGAVYLYTPLAPITRTIASVRRLIRYAHCRHHGRGHSDGFFLSRRLSRPLIRMSKQQRPWPAGIFRPG